MTLTQVAIPVVWAVFVAASIRAFWRHSDDPIKARVYSSTKFTCLFVTVGAALLLPSVLSFPGVPYGINAILWGVVCFPVTLCCMYVASLVFFRIVDAFFVK